jgi:chromosome segregation ATPase
MNPTFTFGVTPVHGVQHFAANGFSETERFLTQQLSDTTAENQRLVKARDELFRRYEDAYERANAMHGVAQKAAAESEALRGEKRKFEDKYQGALAENDRLRKVALQAEEKRMKLEARCSSASNECAQQTLAAEEARKELSASAAGNESLKLQVEFLSESSRNANARNKSLTQEVLKLKAEGRQGEESAVSKLKTEIKTLKAQNEALAAENRTVAECKARNDALAEENAKARAQIAKLKAKLVKRDAVLAEIDKLARGVSKTQ